jgi:hypothetical protein
MLNVVEFAEQIPYLLGLVLCCLLILANWLHKKRSDKNWSVVIASMEGNMIHDSIDLVLVQPRHDYWNGQLLPVSLGFHTSTTFAIYWVAAWICVACKCSLLLIIYKPSSYSLPILCLLMCISELPSPFHQFGLLVALASA